MTVKGKKVGVILILTTPTGKSHTPFLLFAVPERGKREGGLGKRRGGVHALPLNPAPGKEKERKGRDYPPIERV